MIRAPFNFVPLSERVVTDWDAESISHDIPFPDGISGTIDLTITAKSDIFIRNGHTKEDAGANNGKGNEEYNSFSHITAPNGQPLYFIPGSSIKGEVRNILEIMSFSKMTVDKRAMFAQREMNQNFELIRNQRNIHCGWLRRKGSGYEITDCGKPMRISHPNIDAYLGKDIMKEHFSEEGIIDLNKEQGDFDPKTAVYKYYLLKDYSLEGLTFSIYGYNTIGSPIVRYDKGGQINGTIVLTGQPSKWHFERELGAGKYFEFVFENVEVHEPRAISEEEFEHFAFIYKDSKEWPRIESLLDDREGRGVPVFFRCKENEIIDFGMAYIYKVPYKHSVYESLPESHQQTLPDLAQCIFGFTEADDVKAGNTKSLKGRVQFGNAFAIKAEKSQPAEIRLVLGQPRASFYPIYVKQKGTAGHCNNFNTYNDGTPTGWKSYYLREKTWGMTASETTDTWIQPLKKGATFKGTISFHNLRPFELGALLSALTFHKTEGCLHKLGQAKPYGYGKCSYEISLHATELKGLKEADNPKSQTPNLEKYLALFEEAMNEKLGSRWIIKPQIAELLTLAKNEVDGANYEYMVLDPSNRRDDFRNARTNHLYLPLATENGMAAVSGKSLMGDIEKIHLTAIKTHYEDAIQNAYNDKASMKKLEEELIQKKEDAKAPKEKELLDTLYNQAAKRYLELLKPKEKSTWEIFKEGIQAYIPHGSSFNQLAGKLKKWLDIIEETNHPRALSAEDADYAFLKLQEARNATFKKEKTKWQFEGVYHKKCRKIVGKELADVWFSKLNEEKK